MSKICSQGELPCPSMLEEQELSLFRDDYDRLYAENNRLRMYLCATVFLLCIGTFFAYGFWPR